MFCAFWQKIKIHEYDEYVWTTKQTKFSVTHKSVFFAIFNLVLQNLTVLSLQSIDQIRAVFITHLLVWARSMEFAWSYLHMTVMYAFKKQTLTTEKLFFFPVRLFEESWFLLESRIYSIKYHQHASSILIEQSNKS